jgi:ligand-binding SRPBCC domain-containing protein
VYRLRSRQRIPVSLEVAWQFFANPRNLASITPPALGFELRSSPPPEIYSGLIIVYRVRPLFHIPVTWVTEITHVVERSLFVDEQRSGPYRMWHHEHHFTETDGGVEVEDLVSYDLPLGPAGRLVERVLVRPQLRRIFAYRSDVVRSTFGTMCQESGSARTVG